MAWPEKIAHENDLTMAAHARTAEGYLLDRIKAQSLNVTNGAETLGALIYLVDAIVKSAFGIRGRLRMDPGRALPGTASRPGSRTCSFWTPSRRSTAIASRSKAELVSYLRSLRDRADVLPGHAVHGHDAAPGRGADRGGDRRTPGQRAVGAVPRGRVHPRRLPDRSSSDSSVTRRSTPRTTSRSSGRRSRTWPGSHRRRRPTGSPATSARSVSSRRRERRGPATERNDDGRGLRMSVLAVGPATHLDGPLPRRTSVLACSPSPASSSRTETGAWMNGVEPVGLPGGRSPALGALLDRDLPGRRTRSRRSLGRHASISFGLYLPVDCSAHRSETLPEWLRGAEQRPL